MVVEGTLGDADDSLIRRMVEDGFASESTIRRCLEARAAFLERGEEVDLGSVFVREGALTPSQLATLRERIRTQRLDRRSPDEPGADPLVGRRLSGRYEVLERLGRGGMGAVYRARHLGLDRECAIKVLPELAADPGRVERFFREARATSSLDHPNVVRVHDIDRDWDVIYLAMERLEGQSLDRVLEAQGRLPWREACDVAIQAARGLAAAHAAGVIHRDVKPANLMLTPDGVVKVVDFGLARDAASSSELSESGQLLGTVHYMSPEQALGRRDLDHRTDVFSLAATLYHLATGRRPFSGELPAILIEVIETEPPRVDELDPDLPASLGRVVERAMAKEPDRRHPSCEALLVALEAVLAGSDPDAEAEAPLGPATPPPVRGRGRRALAFALAAPLALGLGLALSRSPGEPPDGRPASEPEPPPPETTFPEPPAGPSIAVLPFACLGQEPGQEDLAEGITETLITDLAHLRGLLVISRGSSAVYADRRTDVREVGRALGVRHVLEGTLQQSGPRVRIHAKLVDARSGGQVWAQRYDRPLADVFEIQDEIATEIVRQLDVRLVEGEQAIAWRRTTTALDAYARFAEGQRHFFLLDRDHNLEARRLFEEALAIDPAFAQAIVKLAATHDVEVKFGWCADRDAAIARTRELYASALEVDPDSAEAHAGLGQVHLALGEFDEAIAAGRRAVELLPGGAEVHMLLAYTLGFAGRHAEAIPLMERAMRLSPNHPHFYPKILGKCRLLGGDAGGAIAALQDAARRNPAHVETRIYLAAAHARAGALDRARLEAARVLELQPAFRVDAWQDTAPYRDPADLQRLRGWLRDAGLP